ncbi:thiopurine S-methyltransferase [Thalassoporum mexicanum PCC 7367]|uniref:methyltransferase domain-containing protein n=1 Tax=Thalassoporum mexicanum TaxID=3457544 RepID=UPI00029F87FB|nr:methyltransferase domain-containing protein [Pseudanabaena sp. PCC 7367]AFY70984.1 thiopurine S-methyltransferase [Pseudanabaena sp. PCC 7367]
MSEILDWQSWENRYQVGTTGWDMGQPAPPLVSLLEHDSSLEPGRAVVLGCGNGHDALLFAQHGFTVTGLDFAPSAIDFAQQQAKQLGLEADFLQRDIFNLEPELMGQFDYVIEHTFFCAIAPSQRSDYVKAVRSLLKPQGKLIGLFWLHDRPGGPPYGGSIAELSQLMASSFEQLSFTPAANSIPKRAGDEYIGIFQAKHFDEPA